MDGAGRKQENINEQRRDGKGIREGTKGMLMTEYLARESDVAERAFHSVRAYEARTSCTLV